MADDRIPFTIPATDLIVDPSANRASGRRAAGAQFAAAVSEALAVGFAQSLATQLNKLTLSAGPWVLHHDGKVTRYHSDRPAQVEHVAAELYRLLLGEYETADDADWRADAKAVLDRAHDLLWPDGDQ